MTDARFIEQSRKIVVLGDVMLDVYLSGSVSRISPEAPVPVLRHGSDRQTAGGAANVALNIAALGGRANLIGFVGKDPEADLLRSILTSALVSPTLIPRENVPTICKTRVISGQHQFLRIDREDVADLTAGEEQAVLDALRAALTDASALVLSDYRKGCLSDAILRAAIGMARAKGIPTIVDPKRTDFAAYAGAAYLTPNLAELRAATGRECGSIEDVEEAAKMVIAQTGASVLVTMSERGMALFSASGGERISFPTRAQQVFDVSGAGDTVVAAFALMIAGGGSAADSVQVANAAAGVVVAKLGTATVSREELEDALGPHSSRSRLHEVPASWGEALELRERWRADGHVVGFTNGCFDLIHPGHVQLLAGARATCDKLIVALNTDSSVKRLKGPSRPVQDERARAVVMDAIRDVDLVVLFDQDTPLELITALVPDVLIKGADYEETAIVGADVVKRAGGRVHRVEIVKGHSTTSLIQRSRT